MFLDQFALNEEPNIIYSMYWVCESIHKMSLAYYPNFSARDKYNMAI